jgi:lysophospholipase L1-like esterase
MLLIICAAMACTKSNETTTSGAPPADTITYHDTTHYDTSKTYTYLALGDSYTIGQNVNVSARFPAQAMQLLAIDHIKVDSPLYIATTGWTTSNLLSAIASQNPSPNYDIVTLLIGVNDQYQHVDTATYRNRFTLCLQKAITLSANRTKRVFVLSIPDYSVTPFVPASNKAQVSMEIDWFNAINRQVTAQYNITYIDITPATRQAAFDPTLIANDGLHPSGKEYAVWANMLAPLVKGSL